MFQVNKETTFILIFIKYVAMFIIFSNIIFNEYFLININQKLAIEIENYYINSDYGRAPECFQRLEKEYNKLQKEIY